MQVNACDVEWLAVACYFYVLDNDSKKMSRCQSRQWQYGFTMCSDVGVNSENVTDARLRYATRLPPHGCTLWHKMHQSIPAVFSKIFVWFCFVMLCIGPRTACRHAVSVWVYVYLSVRRVRVFYEARLDFCGNVKHDLCLLTRGRTTHSKHY